MFSPQLASFVRDEMEKTPWTEDTRMCQFQVLRNLGWCAALDGNEAQALKFFRLSRTLSPSRAAEVLVILDRAMLLRGTECPVAANDLTDAAAEIADTIHWENVRGDERLALLVLAESLSYTDSTRAYQFLLQYQSLATPQNATSAHRIDIRAKAYELTAAGTVYRAIGSNSEANDCFKEAFSIWTRIKYRWRAALVVVQLLEVSHAGSLRSGYIDFLRQVTIKDFPRAWFTKSLGRKLNYHTDPLVLSLTPAIAHTLDHILQGHPYKRIADDLSVSTNTIEKRASGIYRTFNVGSQAELISMFAKRGILNR
jgi:DNA-binding CsgD family transcriptional regulator/Tfp pilus assembly protein PilF